MQPHSEAEFQTDLRVALSRSSTDSERRQAIEWQVGRSKDHDYRILEALAAYDFRPHLAQPYCVPLIRALVSVSCLDVEEVLNFYLLSRSCFKRPEIWRKMQDVMFSTKNASFLQSFGKLDVVHRQQILAKVFSYQSYDYHFALEVCCLAERCEWGVLRRLTPYTSDRDEHSVLQVAARRWYDIWLTHQEICRTNDTGAS